MQKGWVYRPEITDYEKLLFYNAMGRHQDSFFYKPIALAKHEEAGLKYRFFCIAIPKAYPDYPSHFADIEVYKSVAGMPYATCLYRQDFDSLLPQRFY
jgi:hypothetical protein